MSQEVKESFLRIKFDFGIYRDTFQVVNFKFWRVIWNFIYNKNSLCFNSFFAY